MSATPSAGSATDRQGGTARSRRELLLDGLKLLFLAIACYLTYRLAANVGWQDLWHHIRRAQPLWLAAASLMLVGRYVAWEIRWRMELASEGEAPHPWIGFASLMVSALVNLITPSVRVFGGLARARYLAGESERPFSTLYGVVLFDQFAHQTVMMSLTWVAFISFAWRIGRLRLAEASTLLLLLAILVLVLWLRRRSRRNRQIRRFFARSAGSGAGRWQTLKHGGKEVAIIASRLLKNRHLRPWLVIMGLAYFALNVGGQWAVFVALGQHESILTVAIVVALGTAAGAITGTPGGLGTTEAAMIESFVLLGTPRLDAVAATFLCRGLHYVMVVALGLPSLISLEIRKRLRGATDSGRRAA
ncbi:MAG TPA: lysylphosphatidylglycerol synthase transmembrane domain-containing protein [Thermoanaerobaculia bacterium]|nr:lysylphosphatidylglycerol synthase transmembrane domain-containing protein [Thermoanaerobaculia bacterium]